MQRIYQKCNENPLLKEEKGQHNRKDQQKYKYKRTKDIVVKRTYEHTVSQLIA